MSNRTPQTVPEFKNAYKRQFASEKVRIEKGDIIAKSYGDDVVIGNTWDMAGIALASYWLEQRIPAWESVDQA